MRYSVEHLLEGVEAYHAQQIDQADAELKAMRERVVTLTGQAADRADEFADILAALAHSLRHQENPFPHGATRDITRAVTARLDNEGAKRLPSAYAIEEAEGNVAKQEERLRQITAQLDWYEEEVTVFLTQLREGGETHVTANGFKLAGFQATSLTQYLRARATREASNA